MEKNGDGVLMQEVINNKMDQESVRILPPMWLTAISYSC